MTLEEAKASIGRRVVYRDTPNHSEVGVITSVGSWVFVRYGSDQQSKATAAWSLELLDGES